ncbi:MAG: hypothetical protein IPI67_27485 [Myxococcales bacterium]|nr:hypothetical protein [Myxococcales bacterium]
MRSVLGQWFVAVTLGSLACACAAESSNGGDDGSIPAGAGGWLNNGDPEADFPTVESGPGDLSTGGAGGPGPGSFGGANGTGGSGATATKSPVNSCPNYDPSLHSHTLTAAPTDPGNTASATRAREQLNTGKTPVPGAVRTSDFFNYFAVPSAADAQPNQLAGKYELRNRVINGQVIPAQYDLFVGVVAGPVSPRPQVALTLLTDGSLTKLALTRVQSTVAALGQGLKAGDVVSLMSTDPSFEPLTLTLSDPTKELADLAQNVKLGGGSVAKRLPDAILVAQETAKKLPAGSWNRILVIGDGEEDANAPDYEAIGSAAFNAQIFLTTVGVSPELAYGDSILYRLSHQGRGRYLYVDSETEADKLFSPTQFDAIFGIARDQIRIRVSLPQYLRSLDAQESPTAGSGSGGTDKYLAPGEWARFVFHLGACSEGSIFDSIDGVQPLEVTVTSAFADGTLKAAPDFTLFSHPGKKLLALSTATPELDQMDSIQSFVDALKYPEVTRFTEATAVLSAQKTNTNVAAELLALLKMHPSYKTQ